MSRFESSDSSASDNSVPAQSGVGLASPAHATATAIIAISAVPRRNWSVLGHGEAPERGVVMDALPPREWPLRVLIQQTGRTCQRRRRQRLVSMNGPVTKPIFGAEVLSTQY